MRTAIKCPNCGHECSEGAAFCASCGKPLTDVSTPTQSEPAVQVQTPPTVNAEAATGGAAATATTSNGSRIVPIVIVIALVLAAVFLFNTCSSNAKQGDSESATGNGKSEFQIWQEEQQQAKPSTLGEWLNSSQEEFDAFGSAISKQVAAYNLYGLFNGKWEVSGNDIKLIFTVRAEGFEDEEGAALWQFFGFDQLTGSVIADSLDINDFTNFIQKVEKAYGISGVTLTVSYVDLSGHPLFTAKFNNQGLTG